MEDFAEYIGTINPNSFLNNKNNVSLWD
jgi:hypothetical protein